MEEKTINIMDLVMLALRKLWILVIATVVCAVAAFGYCKFFLTPSYSATSSILVTNGAVITSYEETTDKISGSDISASLYLADTVVDILNTPDIYIELADTLGEDDFQSLRGGFSVARRSENTLFIDITYSSTDAVKAKETANIFADVACDYIPSFIPSAPCKCSIYCYRCGTDISAHNYDNRRCWYFGCCSYLCGAFYY